MRKYCAEVLSDKCQDIGSALFLCFVFLLISPHKAFAQNSDESEFLSVRFSAGFTQLESTSPVENTNNWRFALQAVFPKSWSGLLIEATYLDWTIGAVFRGQVGGIASLHPPDWTKGRRLGLSCGIQLAEIDLGGIACEVFSTGGLVYHNEDWYYKGGPSDDWPTNHDELQVVGELRLQLRVNQNPMTPLIELTGNWNTTLRKLDNRDRIVKQGMYNVSLLIPVFGLSIN